MGAVVFIVVLILVAIFIPNNILYQEKRNKKDELFDNIQGIDGFSKHRIPHTEILLGVNIYNRKICFVNETLVPVIYDFSQIKLVKTVERAYRKSYGSFVNPRNTEYDRTIAQPYNDDVKGIDLDIEIDAPEITIYSIPFLRRPTKYGTDLYEFAHRNCESWEIKIKENIKKKNYPIKDKLTNNLPIASIADEIQKLKNLLDSGALTIEEFNKQKAKLLNS